MQWPSLLSIVDVMKLWRFFGTSLQEDSVINKHLLKRVGECDKTISSFGDQQTNTEIRSI